MRLRNVPLATSSNESLSNSPLLADRLEIVILPALNSGEVCGKTETEHKANHEYKRDNRIPEWHGWHAARRGLGSNLYRLGVPDMVIQRILRHANVSTMATYYIKTAADNVRNAMAKLEKVIPTTSKVVEFGGEGGIRTRGRVENKGKSFRINQQFPPKTLTSAPA